MIKSINFDEGEILQNIIDLYTPNGFELDPTFSKGNFYKRFNIKEPIYKSDLEPESVGVQKVDCRQTPFPDKFVSSIIFDPPFVIGGKTFKESKDGSCIIAKRFQSFPSWEEITSMYSDSLREFHRILKDGGILAFKCQDCISGGKQHLTHAWIIYEAVKFGFYPKDLFVLLAKNRITDSRKQQHSRKYHSYWLVFEKTKSKINYNIGN